MKRMLVLAVCFTMLQFALAQEKSGSSQVAGQQVSAVLEGKVRKAWEDFKKKDKKSFSAILADEFREVEEDGGGLRDAKAEVAEIDAFDINQYTLSDFTVHPIGNEAALVNYVASYSGSAGGQKVDGKEVCAEIWVKHGGTWKVLYVQSTNVK